MEAAKDAYAGARDKVTAEYAPAVGAAAATAAASAAPLVSAATDRGRALVRSVGKEPVVVVPPKKKRSWFGTLAVVAAAAGATYVLVRKLVGRQGLAVADRPPDHAVRAARLGRGRRRRAAEPETAGARRDRRRRQHHVALRHGGHAGRLDRPRRGRGRARRSPPGTRTSTRSPRSTRAPTHRPRRPPPPTPGPPATRGRGEQTGDEHSSGDTVGAEQVGAGAEAPYADEKIETELETVEERAYEEPADAVWAEQDTATGGGPDAHPERYDMAGVYVGVEPPEGYPSRATSGR